MPDKVPCCFTCECGPHNDDEKNAALVKALDAFEKINRTIEDDKYPVLTTVLNISQSALAELRKVLGE